MIAPPYSPIFEMFWAAYPWHAGKGAAWKAFTTLQMTATDVPVLLEALAWQVHQPQWTKDNGQWIPRASTWLSQRRWEDEPFHPLVVTVTARTWDECPHTPVCHERRWCALKTAKAREAQAS